LNYFEYSIVYLEGARTAEVFFAPPVKTAITRSPSYAVITPPSLLIISDVHRKIDERKPDLIITDITMPGMDGFELCSKIKEDERFKDIPAIILTALSDPHDVIKGLASGADNFVTKPFEEENLLARIEYLINDRDKPRCISVPKNIEITFNGHSYSISSDRRQIFNLFLSTYEAAFHKNRELVNAQNELRELNAKLEASNKELELTNVKLEAAYQDLELNTVELETANRALESFGYTVSHDLRQPLNIISLHRQAIEIIHGEQLGEGKKIVHEIANQTLKMCDTISSLLDLSKLKHSKPESEKVDLSCIVNIISEELKMTMPNRKVIFEIEDGLTVIGDSKLLRIALENLVGNAWKYSSKREETLIAFGKTVFNENPTYFVRDNGEGFEPLESDKLFNPFERLSKEHEGHGIGLSTVHRIIKHHGGHIWAEGEPGIGATFFFTL